MTNKLKNQLKLTDSSFDQVPTRSGRCGEVEPISTLPH